MLLFACYYAMPLLDRAIMEVIVPRHQDGTTSTESAILFLPRPTPGRGSYEIAKDCIVDVR
jgi:hypothetical protein